MANMGYCRFRNTLSDLRDCENTLGEGDWDGLSEDEKEAALSMINVCRRIAQYPDRRGHTAQVVVNED